MSLIRGLTIQQSLVRAGWAWCAQVACQLTDIAILGAGHTDDDVSRFRVELNHCVLLAASTKRRVR